MSEKGKYKFQDPTRQKFEKKPSTGISKNQKGAFGLKEKIVGELISECPMVVVLFYAGAREDGTYYTTKEIARIAKPTAPKEHIGVISGSIGAAAMELMAAEEYSDVLRLRRRAKLAKNAQFGSDQHKELSKQVGKKN